MIDEIKEKLINNPIHIKNILEYYEFYNVDVRSSQEIRCGVDKDSNKTSVRIKLKNNQFLYVTDYGRGLNCDLINFIIQSRNVEFKHVINTIKNELGIDSFTYEKRKSIFGGFYNKIKSRKTNSIELKTYDENILNQYLHKYNLMFFRDGISFETQRKFKIGLDTLSQRIICPWWSFDGQLVGITGRYIGDYEEDNTLKWCPVIPHAKSQTLYGYTENYQHLQGCEELYVGESEKFTLQLDSMEIYTGLGLGGNSIHYPQIIHIIALQPKKLILGFDEGLEEEIILNQITKIKPMIKFYDIKLGYIYDNENKILPKDSKMSPTDLGKEKFIELKNNYVKWV